MWNIVQCAVQGRSHIKSGTPCQDKVFSWSKNKCNVIALADGAGSAKFSHFGAGSVTRFMSKAICNDFDNLFNENNGVEIKQKLIDCINHCLADLAQELKCEKTDLASTFLLAAVCVDRYILIHLGDGVIGYLKNDELKIASFPENEEFANVTYFTTSREAIQKIKIIKGNLGNISGFALMSDGTEFSFLDKRNKCLCEALKKIMVESKGHNADLNNEVREFFESHVKQKTSDDCSLITIVKAPDIGIISRIQIFIKKSLNKIFMFFRHFINKGNN